MDNEIAFQIYIPDPSHATTDSMSVCFFKDGTYRLLGVNDYGPWKSEIMKWRWLDGTIWLKPTETESELMAPNEAAMAYERYLATQVVS